ncbi:MAG: hypothetical protein AABX00_00860 [Nanoarchaeota archaeon]
MVRLNKYQITCREIFTGTRAPFSSDFVWYTGLADTASAAEEFVRKVRECDGVWFRKHIGQRLTHASGQTIEDLVEISNDPQTIFVSKEAMQERAAVPEATTQLLVWGSYVYSWQNETMQKLLPVKFYVEKRKRKPYDS